MLIRGDKKELLRRDRLDRPTAALHVKVQDVRMAGNTHNTETVLASCCWSYGLSELKHKISSPSLFCDHDTSYR